MRASRKAYGSNSFFQSYIKIHYHQRDFCGQGYYRAWLSGRLEKALVTEFASKLSAWSDTKLKLMTSES